MTAVRPAKRPGIRVTLLHGASAFALATALYAGNAQADSTATIRAVAALAAAAAPKPPATTATQSTQSPGNQGMQSATLRALQYEARVNQGVTLAQQAQSAAQAAAATLVVPDGVTTGGLDPVKLPQSAASDPTGLNTWDGASAPTQTASGGAVTVTIQQTQAQAVLSWTTFNVGKNTTVNFNQTQNGTAQKGWIALNRVVGQLNPLTGLRDASDTPAPSVILGAIKSQGTVLVLNQNGVIFGPNSQINTNSLIATSLEIGRATDSVLGPLTIKERNQEFLDFGLLGFADQATVAQKPTAFTFSAQAIDSANFDPLLEGTIQVDAGAQITTGTGGFVLLTGPSVVNSGHIVSPQGEVALQSGREVTLQRSTGDSTSDDPNVRGFTLSALARTDTVGNYVQNTASGWIEASEGFISLAATDNGGVLQQGLLQATTSVSRNGYVRIYGGDIKLDVGSTISILPDDSDETIPQDPTSLLDFKSSKVSIGNSFQGSELPAASRIEIDDNSIIYAPGADVSIGSKPGLQTLAGALDPGGSRIFMDSGAIIDVAGLPDVLIPASRNSIEISPVTNNDLQDTPTSKGTFLSGATVFVDPRLSGVRADGVTWIGSPLIPAESYYQQVGVTASELMTKGGNITMSVASVAPGTDPSLVPDIIIKPGAILDMSGGWVTYEAGIVKTTQLLDSAGQVIDIGAADPNDTYVGIASGYTVTQPRWGVTDTWANPLLDGGLTVEGSYTEGRDAGSLVLRTPSLVLDGTLYGQAYAGTQQLLDATPGTATSSITGDKRLLQGAPSQLPAGALLFIDALATDANGNVTGGGDVSITGSYATIDPALAFGQSISLDATNKLVTPPRDPASILTPDRQNTILLSTDALNGMGLSQLTVDTSGAVTVGADAALTLNPGGVFDVTAGRAITIDGSVTAASGKILLETVNAGIGNIFTGDVAQPGSFDVTVNGSVSTRGRWVNDFGATSDTLLGDSFTNGGLISIIAAPRVSELQETAQTTDKQAPDTNVDISGSILINSGSRVDVSGGGYAKVDGTFDLSAKGGSLSLIDDTNYFELTNDTSNRSAGGLPGFRVSTITNSGGNTVVAVNPSAITSRVSIADGSILAAGFGGGGTFTLDTPAFGFGSGPVSVGTQLPLDFVSSTGFANYNITSYATDIEANNFTNKLGGYNAVLTTQVVTIGNGQTLSLAQSYLSPILTQDQIGDLRGLASGGDLYSVVTPSVPTDAWDQKAVSLTLGGLLELHVAQGGTVTGTAGSKLTVSELFNEGTIRIPGGTVAQAEILPSVYFGQNALGVHDLNDVFATNASGQWNDNSKNALGLKNGTTSVLTNAQVAGAYAIYLLGDLDAGEGVRLAPGSITDLSGISIVNPRAPVIGFRNTTQAHQGIVVAGGTLETLGSQQLSGSLFHVGFGVSVFGSETAQGIRMPDALNAASGAVINLSGASDSFDQLQVNGSLASTPAWSNAGTLQLGNGGTITGADIQAAGGAPLAAGGTLIWLDPTLTQVDPAAPTANTVSAAMIESAGFDTFVAQGSITSNGDVKLNLDNAFFLTSAPFTGLGGQSLSSAATRDSLAPTIRSGGTMEIDAPYIAFDSDFQELSTPNYGVAGTNTAIFHGKEIDIMGAVLADNSVGQLQLLADGDLRLTGVEPWQQTFNVNAQAAANSLIGQLAVNGDLLITAGQLYPTTGSSFFLTSSAASGSIVFARSPGDVPATPYSAGGALTIQAATIDQGGVIRVPLGSLTIGGNAPIVLGTDGTTDVFAPATQTVDVASGSVTSVSADGLTIPYGTTTDQIEWFFSPTGSNELTAPPAAVLHFAGSNVSLDSGSTVDIKGGGDLYAYEFVPGNGGSRDILDRLNADPFSSQNGLQYPDGRQVYAIVPGLSDATVAAFDPIYSSDYGALYAPSNAGLRVWLNAAPGLAAGWYTLLPAKYAMLPGGMRVVEQSASAPVPSGSGTLNDGSLIVTGYFGTADSQESTVRTFNVMSQSTILKYSNIALTTANAKFAADAAKNGLVTPRLPIDAGRLILDPATTLAVNTQVETTPGTGGRGAQADISGKAFDIVSTLPDTLPTDGTIVLTAGSLSDLNASSLLIGGVRTDNSDGTTSLAITADAITVENDATHPLTSPEIVLAVDGSGAAINLLDGATIKSTGTLDDPRSGDYLISGSAGGMTGQGAVLRVASGAERQVTRANVVAGTIGGVLNIGAADLEGTSLLLESSGDLHVSPQSTIVTTNLAVGAGKVTFTSNPAITTGLVITPQLQALFGQAAHLTIRTPQTIDFSDGTYAFGNLTLDAPGLLLLDGSKVELDTGALTLANSSAALDGCAMLGSCGSGDLLINASSITFGSGTIRTYGFGGSTDLNSAGGIFYDGTGVFDAGIAKLTIETPFIGDAALPLASGQDALIPSLSIATTGDIAISNPSAAATPSESGTPGATLSLSGNDISVSAATLRATAGDLTLTAVGNIAVSDGAILETPGYSKSFGDSADPVSVSAPGGTLSLIATTGGIDLAAGTTLSIGGGTGNAGTLKLEAANGSIALGATIDANAPGGGASLVLDQSDSLDLGNFLSLIDGAFTGTIDIRTGNGDLDLTSDRTLQAQNVSLTADGGKVDIAGKIDVSGTSGGNVSLFGEDGVTLESTALIDAHANGYGLTDTRQASGGNVAIGTDGSGAISVASGAVIDVGARQLGDRLVPSVRNGVTYYSYVQADTGGTVSFRAPVIEQAGGDTVNVSFAGTVTGASQVVLEGFKRFDLAAIANDPNFVGVTINPQGQAVLNLGVEGTGSQVNFLADRAPGTLVEFVQDFDVSKDNGNLGSLTSLSSFHERPGMELDYSGDIVLASNWNLGAGTVNVAAAVAAGDMAPDPSVPGKFFVVPGKEGDLFQRFTTMVYRTDVNHDGTGDVTGEPGVLTLRAGGTLDIEGSISDGFFQFRDQTDPGYLNVQLGGGTPVFTPYLFTQCFGGACAGVVDYGSLAIPPTTYVQIGVPAASSLAGLLQNPAPYSAAANTPAALGSLPGNTGDPIGSAELFPLLTDSSGASLPVQSWSYNLVGGANLASADPMRVMAGAAGGVTVEGTSSYSYIAALKGTGTFNSDLLMNVGSSFVAPSDWSQDFLGANSSLDPNSYTFVNFGSAPLDVRTFLLNQANSFFASDPSQFQLVTQGTKTNGFFTTLALAGQFMSQVFAPNFTMFQAEYKAPAINRPKTLTTATTSTLVRSGSGDIAVAAAGNIDLRNGALPTYLGLDGTPEDPADGGLQVGGTAIYTAGYRADLTPRTIVDAITGETFTVDRSGLAITSNIFDQPFPNGYQYGAGALPDSLGTGYTGILIANPVYAEGGGSVSLDAGQDVLGRRDIWQEARIGRFYDTTTAFGDTWIGTGDQAWRTGDVGSDTNLRIDPQLFGEGVGALGGGDITVNAGRDISDLSIVSDSSVTTANVTGPGTGTQALWTVGGGNVNVTAGRDLVGGRLDVASGTGTVVAGGSIASGGTIQIDQTGDTALNDLRVRVSDASVALDAGNTIQLDGIAALGVLGTSTDFEKNLDGRGFYSPASGVSLLANGTVSVDNIGNDVVTPSDASTELTRTAVWPGSFEATSVTGDLSLVGNSTLAAKDIVLYPSPIGELSLFAGGDIDPVTLAMEDADPGLLPGAFSSFHADSSAGVVSGQTFIFPGVLPNTSDVERSQLHNSTPTHEGDPIPVRVYAGGDITDVILSVAKSARIGAGRDIVNMMFFGQNLSASDVTRIVAGRDITATTQLMHPLLPNGQLGEPLAALQGNTFIIGGPGSFFLEAGRDAGPFLNSATTNGFITSGSFQVPAGLQSYGGGILSVGNDWNPWLASKSADLYVMFGVAPGANFDALRDYYLDPANLPNLNGDLFVQVKDSSGNLVPDRSQPIYQPILLQWMQANASLELENAYGTTNVTFDQAYAAFKALPELTQRVFLLNDVYFNELTETSIPTGPSYKQYSRGYLAVNTLFPASLGYTLNDSSGGSNGANQLVHTGDLDLRLATIQTTRGGNIFILGPGGNVLAGSTVRTADQVSRRVYNGGALFAGNVQNSPIVAAITAIPLGDEGILTLRGGTIDTFTDGNFLLNQSRLFTEDGGSIAMWSSNGNLNAGQGPKTSANFPPIVVQVDEDLLSQINSAGAVSGAGIAAFKPASDVPAPDVFLIAPRGTVDAGDPGVRVAGNLYIAAQSVANANNFSVSGQSFGIPSAATVDVNLQNSAGATTAAATQAAQAVAGNQKRGPEQTIIIVDVIGYAGSESEDEDEKKKRKKKQQ